MGMRTLALETFQRQCLCLQSLGLLLDTFLGIIYAPTQGMRSLHAKLVYCVIVFNGLDSIPTWSIDIVLDCNWSLGASLEMLRIKSGSKMRNLTQVVERGRTRLHYESKLSPR
ncbi:hypothetical protein BKA66DRAFT_309602 [Pyrenochaeta sp. MPI-SDFR-AT-0127]|nr:hypothetical protein BKA66DRAFT_309602 [Pyrenochaeta sp. MPI-SDFR-AT-0127]